VCVASGSARFIGSGETVDFIFWRARGGGYTSGGGFITEEIAVGMASRTPASAEPYGICEFCPYRYHGPYLGALLLRSLCGSLFLHGLCGSLFLRDLCGSLFAAPVAQP
jgi:hypothetical protein